MRYDRRTLLIYKLSDYHAGELQHSFLHGPAMLSATDGEILLLPVRVRHVLRMHERDCLQFIRLCSE